MSFSNCLEDSIKVGDIVYLKVKDASGQWIDKEEPYVVLFIRGNSYANLQNVAKDSGYFIDFGRKYKSLKFRVIP